MCPSFLQQGHIFSLIFAQNVAIIRTSVLLKLAVSQLVNINESEWINYVPTPLKFIEIDSKNFFGIERKFIDQNLDYLVDRLVRRW